MSSIDCLSLVRAAGLDVTGVTTENLPLCAICEKAKLKKVPIAAQAARDPNVAPGQVIHMDIKGPIETKAYNGATYSAIFVDEATRWTVAVDMTAKSKAPEALRQALVEFQSVHIVIQPGAILHGDSDSVLLSQQFKEVLTEQKMVFRASPPYTHQRNGIAERTIQTLFDMVRTLLLQASFPQSYWNVALAHAVYLRNRCPTSALGQQSPF